MKVSHEEEAFKKTEPLQRISYEFSEKLKYNLTKNSRNKKSPEERLKCINASFRDGIEKKQLACFFGKISV
ncbi:hypothetical protein [Candidatus Protochlamydia naegleriophila]|uniref:hypothetical protein n=1 Tax=Candidatus Protochlamydia naegleriophila TaxID=389348 RepID=UPI001300DC5E|nr:hypothetical protein [Candidatus Protochlamydia naegleriophila]